MRYLCNNPAVSCVFFCIFGASIIRDSKSDVVPYPDQHFQYGYSYPRPNTQDVNLPAHVQGMPQYKTAQVGHQSRSSRGIPIDLAMKLNTITDESELFNKYIENGHDLLVSSYPASMARANNRRSLDVEGTEEIGGARIGRVADARNYPTRDPEIEPHQTVHVATLNAVASKNNNRQGSNRGDLDENTLDDKPPIVFRAETQPKTPRPAICEPEIRTVTLKDVDDPTFFYYPSCTRVKRCGGCCVHDLLSCQPKMLQYTNYTVNLSKYHGKDKMTYFGKKVITVEEHLNCSCQCKVKSKDCTAQQRYEKLNCRCVCKNEDEEAQCTREQHIKLWNPATCSCQCRDRSDCSSGYYFDRELCACLPNQKPNTLLLPEYSIDRTGFRTNYDQQPYPSL